MAGCNRPEGYPETPNLDKALEVKEQSQSIGEFLEWCSEKGWFFCEYKKDYYQGEMPRPIRSNRERLLAEFFGIDYDAINKEQEQVLNYVRKNSV